MADPYRPSLDDPNFWVPYRYHPSRIAAVVFVVVFALTTIWHAFQVCKKRTWYFIPLVIGGIFEILGYVGRILSTQDLWALGPYIMQSLLLLVAPALFAASIYIVLGRIMLLVDGERHSLIRHKWLTKTFVIGDVISFLVQGGGGGIQAGGTLAMLHTGEIIIVVGLFLQLAFFGFFIVVAGLFHYRFVKANAVLALRYQRESTHQDLFCGKMRPGHSPEMDHEVSGQHPTISAYQLPWRRHLYILYFTSGLIMIRSIFRVVEYLQGNDGYLLRHEVYLYIFDALLMLVVMCSFNWVHPAQITDLAQQRKSQSDTIVLQPHSENLQSGIV